jgi:parvulin-like peptidyl-prolyl isomerase
MAKQPNPKVLSKKHLARLERERIQRRYLVIGTIVVAALVAGLILYGVLDQTVFKRIRPVAKVGNTNITSGQFIDEVRFDRFRSIQQLQSLTSDPTMVQFFGTYIQQIGSRLVSPTTLGQEVLDSMIEDILVAKKAEELGIKLSDEEIDREMEQQFGFYENGTPTPTITSTPYTYSTSTLSPTQLALIPPTQTPLPTATAGPTETAASATEVAASTATAEVNLTLEASPAAAENVTLTPETTPTVTSTPTITPTPTQYTRELYNSEVSQYVSGASEIQLNKAELRDFIRRQLLKRKVFEALTKDVKPVGEQVWARHILVASEDEAKKVRERLDAGEDFATLARELSIDEGSKAQGGELKWFYHGEMVKEFDAAAYALNIGEISQPVKSDNGYHIIQVLGKEERPLTDTQISAYKQKIYNDWLEQAKKDTPVTTYDRWVEIVPSDPLIPDSVLQVLQQISSSTPQ